MVLLFQAGILKRDKENFGRMIYDPGRSNSVCDTEIVKSQTKDCTV
jgi:hypothetical protein